MLVMTSNWAVSDGSLTGAGAARAVTWLEAIRRSVVRAGCGRDGRYRPVAELTIVFAGDTFDWLLSDAWAGRHRPWQDGRQATELRARVAAATLHAVWPAARTLLRWRRRGMPVPAADTRGRPSDRAFATVAVQIVLLAGDRDRWLPELPLTMRRGLHVGEEWSDGHLHIRHGHDLDALTHVPAAGPVDRERAPTLAESLTVDLLVPFALAAREEPSLWPIVRPALGAIAAARPATMPSLIARLAASDLGRWGAGHARSRIQALWRGHVARWHRVARRNAVACEAEFDALGGVAAWLDQLDPGTGCPAAVTRLDPTPSSLECRSGLLVGHAAHSVSPILACRQGGRSWCEQLAPTPLGPGVVTVGADAAGGRFIDAA